MVNEGQITIRDAGIAALVAPSVGNSGAITARLGKVTLAAGEAFVLDLFGDKLLSFVVDPAALARLADTQGQPLAARVDHSGNIVADGGQVQITAQTAQRLLDSSINVSGLVQATTVASRPGWISLLGDGGTQVRLSGRMDVSGDKGGRVDVTGGQVSLAAGAQVDASGRTGGGTVAIGGSWQGGGALAVARAVTVEAGAHLEASATDNGNGGTVSVFASGDTVYGGDVVARGGALGGDGGRVEVSGLGRLAFAGDVNASATAGRSGSLLLDPTNVTVAAAGGALPAVGAAGDFTVGVDNLRRVLTRGTSVALEAGNTITVNAAIDGRLPSGGIAGGGLTLTAGGDVTLNNNVILHDGAFSATAGGRFTQAAGNLLATGSGSIAVSAAAGIQAQQLITSGGAVGLASSGGAVNVGQAIVGLGSSGRAGALTVSGTGVVLNGGRVGAATLTAGAAGVQLRGVFDAVGALNVFTPGELMVGSANATDVKLRRASDSDDAAGRFTLSGALVASGTVDVKTSDAVALHSGSGIQSGGQLALTTAQALSTDAATSATQPAATLLAGGAVELRASSLNLAGDLQAGGSARSLLHADGAAQISGKLLANGTGALRIEGASVSHTGSNAIAAGSSGLDIEATSGGLQTQQLLTTGDVKLRALNGALVVGKAIVGPSPVTQPTLLVDAGALDVAGQSVQLAGGRFARGAQIASGGALTLTDTLQTAGTAALAAPGDVTLAAVSAGSLSLRATLGGGAAAGGALALKGDIKSAGAIDLKTAAMATTDAGVKVEAAGDLSMSAAAIRIGAGILGADPALPVSATNALNTAGAGLRTTAANSTLTLIATGTASGAGYGIDVLGSLRTTATGSKVQLVAAAGDVHVAELAGSAAQAVNATTTKLVLDKAYAPTLAVTTSGDFQLVQEAVTAGDFSASVRGAFAQGAGGLINSGAGKITIDAHRGLAAQQLVSDGGAVSLASTGGAVSVAKALVGPGTAAEYKRTGAFTASGTSVAVSGGRMASASLTATGGGGIDVQDTLDAAGLLSLRTDGAVTLASATVQGASLRGQAGGDSRAGSFSLTGSLVSNGLADVDLRTSGAITLQGGTVDSTGNQSAGIQSAYVLTLDTSAALAANSNIIATGAGALSVRAATFTQGAASKISAGSAGLKIATTGDLTAGGQLLSVGDVYLGSAGGALKVSKAIVAPSLVATSAVAEKATTLTAAGQSVVLSGGRFGGAVNVTSLSTMDLQGTLASDSGVTLAAAGDVTLGDVAANGLKLRRTIDGSAPAGGTLTVAGNIVSTAGIDLAAAGAFSTRPGSQLLADGDITVEARTILIAQGAGLARPADAGVLARGTAALTLTAHGDATFAAGVTTLDVQSSVRTEGGALTLLAEAGGMNVVEAAGGAMKMEARAGSLALGRAYGSGLTLAVAGGNVLLKDEVGVSGAFSASSNTGSVTQQDSGRKLVQAGSIEMTAPSGAILARQLVTSGAVHLEGSGAVTVTDPILGPGTNGRAAAMTLGGSSITLAGGRTGTVTAAASGGGNVVLGGILDAQGLVSLRTTGAVSVALLRSRGLRLRGDESDASRVGSFTLSNAISGDGTAADTDLRVVSSLTLAAGTSLASSGGVTIDTLGNFALAAGAKLGGAEAVSVRASQITLAGEAAGGGSADSVFTSTGPAAVSLTGVVKVSGTGMLRFTGAGFTQAGQSSLLESGSGGTAIAVGTGNLDVMTLTSSGQVRLVGGRVTVARPIVGPGDDNALAGGLDLQSGQSVTLPGGRFSGDVSVSSGGTLAVTEPLVAGGAVGLGAAGAVTLSGGLKVGSLQIADLPFGTGFASGGVSVDASVDSTRDVTVRSLGVVATTGGASIQSGGHIALTGQRILIGAAAAPAAADTAGLATVGAAAAGIELLATGGNAASGSTPEAIHVDGSLRTAGGDLKVMATGAGADIRVAVIGTTTPGARTGPATGRSGVTTIQAPNGSVVLSQSLGGSNTGYTDYAGGYRADLKPAVGELRVLAARDIETNGLNLDGTAAVVGTDYAAHVGTAAGKSYGLLLQTTGPNGRIIVNDKIAVNKGDVRLDAGSGALLVGASIHSRGHDPAPLGGGDQSAHVAKSAYAIRLLGSTLSLWDNDPGYATIYAPGISNPRTGDLLTREVAKITIANNSANYVGPNDTRLVLPPPNVEPPQIELGANISYAALAADTRVRAGSTVTVQGGTPVALKFLTFPLFQNSFNYGYYYDQSSVVDGTVINANYTVRPPGAPVSLPPNSPYDVVGLNYGSASNVQLPAGTIVPQFFGSNLLINGTPGSAGYFKSSFIELYGRYVEGGYDGTRLLIYPSIIAASGVQIGIDANGNQYGSGTTTQTGTMPTNSSQTGFAAIGGFGAIDVRNNTQVGPAQVVLTTVGSVQTPGGGAAGPGAFGNAGTPSVAGQTAAAISGVVNGTSGNVAGSAGALGVAQAVNGANASAPAVSAVVGRPELSTVQLPAADDLTLLATPTAAGPAVEVLQQTVAQEPAPLVLLVMRPAAQADLGRGGAQQGAAANVFGRRWLLGRNADPRVCAPDDLESIDAASGATRCR